MFLPPFLRQRKKSSTEGGFLYRCFRRCTVKSSLPLLKGCLSLSKEKGSERLKTDRVGWCC